ncbi:hypothetical protein EYC80_000410 [Monilinia laxa]|uniref:Uncharacterized protein n=1 Tax=Monilinia laxa TaxID=61186 RepID=A0A5N6KAL3_MONLA|nr:hypothetical protein EYC80_000410 [Monilinia laxa]
MAMARSHYGSRRSRSDSFDSIVRIGSEIEPKFHGISSLKIIHSMISKSIGHRTFIACIEFSPSYLQ